MSKSLLQEGRTEGDDDLVSFCSESFISSLRRIYVVVSEAELGLVNRFLLIDDYQGLRRFLVVLLHDLTSFIKDLYVFVVQEGVNRIEALRRLNREPN